MEPGTYTVIEIEPPNYIIGARGEKIEVDYEFDEYNNEKEIYVEPLNIHNRVGKISMANALAYALKTMVANLERDSKYKDEKEALSRAILLISDSDEIYTYDETDVIKKVPYTMYANVPKDSKNDVIDYYLGYGAGYNSLPINLTLSDGRVITQMSSLTTAADTEDKEKRIAEYLGQVYSKYTGKSRSVDDVYNMCYSVMAKGYTGEVIENFPDGSLVGNLRIYKTDTTDATKSLKGTKFKVYKMVGNDANGTIYAKKTSEDGVYEYDEEYDQNSGTDIENIFETNEKGYIDILNLKPGNYRVVEFEPTPGYKYSTTGSKVVTVYYKDKNKGKDLEDLTDALSLMFYNMIDEEHPYLDIVSLFESLMVKNTKNTTVMDLENHYIQYLYMMDVDYSNVTDYDIIREIIDKVMNLSDVPSIISVDGNVSIQRKHKSDSEFSLFDAIQTVKTGEGVGKYTDSDISLAEKHIKEYIVQVYNKYTELDSRRATQNRKVDNKYNLGYYEIAIGNASAVFANEPNPLLIVEKLDNVTRIGINGITFIIQNEKGEYVYEENGQWKFTKTINNAKEFKTETKEYVYQGRIKIEGLPEGKYKIIETSTGSTGYPLPTNNVTDVELKGNGVQKIEIKSVIPNDAKWYKNYPVPEITKKLYISGKAWKDIPATEENKNKNETNNKYDSGIDELFGGMYVALLNDSGNVENSTNTSTTGTGKGTYRMEINIQSVLEKVKNNADVSAARKAIEDFKTRDFDKYIEKIEERIKNLNEILTDLRNTNTNKKYDKYIADGESEKASLEDLKSKLTKEKKEAEEQYDNLCKVYTNAFNKVYWEEIQTLLKTLKIQFSYDGVTYQNVKKQEVDIKNGTTSVAAEKDEDRKQFNKDFEIITGNDTIRGQKITYNTSNPNDIKINQVFLIDAFTDPLSKYLSMINAEDEESEIKHINIGVVSRSMPNLSIDNDVYKADIAVNGRNFAYVYGKADGAQTTTVGVQFERNMQLDGFDRYMTPVYRADVTDTTNFTSNFEMKVTYKIKVINEHAELYAKVRTLETYFSTQYNISKIYSGDANGIEKDVNGKQKELSTTIGEKANVAGNKHYTISGLNLNIPSKNSGQENAKYIYVEFNLPRDKVIEALNNPDVDYNLYNIVEISSYSNYTDSKFSEPYAGFDTNSIPNNRYETNTTAANYNSKQPEDDTNDAPGLKIVEATERTISGNVFVDEAISEKVLNGERLGNGIYDLGEETTIEGVKVTLTDVDNGYTYPATTTDENGYYEIKDFPVGNYKITYTWGNTQYNPTEYKATTLNSDYVSEMEALGTNKKSEWYRPVNQETRYSEAMDDAATRYSIDRGIGNEFVFEDMIGAALPETVPTMTSTTDEMDIQIDVLADENWEYTEKDGYRTYYYNIQNIDFGIIERPRQGMQVTKDLVHIKIVDDAETIIAESDIKDGKLENPNVNYTVYLPKSDKNVFGAVKAELDNGLLPVEIYATYEVSVKNTSEKDYYREGGNELSYYYQYGETDPEGKDIPLKLKATGVYDYIEEKFAIESMKESRDEDANDVGYTTKTVLDYNDGRYMGSETTILEKAYERLREFLEEENKAIYDWATDKKEIKQVFEEWYNTNTEVSTARKSKLSKSKILELESLELKASEEGLKAGESKSVIINAQAPVTSVSSGDDIELKNQTEITDIERVQDYGRRQFETYTTLYDQGEKILVTSPTGEDRDNSSTIIIITTTVAAIVVLGIGIIFIKKKVINTNKI